MNRAHHIIIMKSVIKFLRVSPLAMLIAYAGAVRASNNPLCFTARNGSVTVNKYMFNGCSALKVNIAPPGKNWSINASSIGNDALTDMLTNTGGTMNSTPSANTTYYILIKDSICYDTICLGESFTNYGFNIDASDIHSCDNTFTRTITATPVGNPDTLITLYLYVPETDYDITETINEGESYTCGDNQYSESGDYTIALVSKEGCDSIVHLHLIVIDSPTAVDNAEMYRVNVYSENNKIVVNGVEGHELRVYDAVGRLLAIKESASEIESVDVPSTGIYFVTLDNSANMRIVVR